MAEQKSRANKGASLTLKDVATRAGVSSMTVSRVLNHEPNVKAHTREKVMAVVKELGYRPNLSARSLAAGQSLFIGLLYNNPSAAYMSEFLIGAMNACRLKGYHLVLENCGETNEEWDEAVGNVLNDGRFMGVIVPPPVCNYPSVMDAIADAGLPCVRVSPNEDLAGASTVNINDFEAAKAATERLIDLGHKRIAFIKGHPNQAASRERHAGFMAAMADHGLQVPDTHVCQGYFDYKSGLASAEKLLTLQGRPTAIFASNDDMAAAVVALAAKYNLHVPTDLSVIGFDDTTIATTIWPQLSTVRQPISEMAAAAVDLVISHGQKADDSDDRTETFNFTLVERESTAPAPLGT